MERYRRHRTRSHCNRARVVAQRCDGLAARFFRDIMRVADARENKMALVPSKFRDPNPSGAKMLARVRVVIGVSRLGCWAASPSAAYRDPPRTALLAASFSH